MSTRDTADALDLLADNCMVVTRDATVGSTMVELFGRLARTLVVTAAQLRTAADSSDDDSARRQAALTASRAIASSSFDPAAHSVAEVNEHLADAPPEEQARVLAIESQDRPDVPDGKKQRAGGLAGPHAAVH